MLPLFSVNLIPYKVTQKGFIPNSSLNMPNKEYVQYQEGLSWYFAIILNDDEIQIKKEVPFEILEFKANPLKCKIDENGVKYGYFERDDAYLPVIIKNIGVRDAVNFSFRIFKDGEISEKFSKYITARPFSLENELRLDFYIPEIQKSRKYWLELSYYDILGNKYTQKDKIMFGEDAGFYLEFKQELNRD